MSINLFGIYIVVLLDCIFENVCELDLIYEFEKAYLLLDEYILAGEIQDTSNKEILTSLNGGEEYERQKNLTEILDENF
ncbi:clathrin-adaptor small chain [Tieghemostelium lacteum]|uniref:Clathrin-adaptor small chain n=1 Tax=Tieghemostelium lacteum TaxID=361077 RepID=A0A151Z8H2_TIELA|nr:clathrin-adaptor small chain [Tieghemostelium lacteum]|eukprot:KYQ90266.1 clathrin-adaptor small chain [Tieghemostelium lacteum]